MMDLHYLLQIEPIKRVIDIYLDLDRFFSNFHTFEKIHLKHRHLTYDQTLDYNQLFKDYNIFKKIQHKHSDLIYDPKVDYSKISKILLKEVKLSKDLSVYFIEDALEGFKTIKTEIYLSHDEGIEFVCFKNEVVPLHTMMLKFEKNIKFCCSFDDKHLFVEGQATIYQILESLCNWATNEYNILIKAIDYCTDDECFLNSGGKQCYEVFCEQIFK